MRRAWPCASPSATPSQRSTTSGSRFRTEDASPRISGCRPARTLLRCRRSSRSRPTGTRTTRRRRDAVRHPYFAEHGYASLRVDIRGSGASSGVLLDEYTEQEQEDVCAALEWVAAQSWCTGSLGMIGLSWGGFAALQAAARRPAALKAVVAALRQRRPLRRRRQVPRRLRPRLRAPSLVVDDARDERPPAGPRPRGRGLAGALARAPRAGRSVRRDLARPSAARRVLAHRARPPTTTRRWSAPSTRWAAGPTHIARRSSTCSPRSPVHARV